MNKEIPPQKLTGLKQRLFSALVLGGVSLAFFYIGSWPLLAFILFGFSLCFIEWYKIVKSLNFRFTLYITGIIYFFSAGVSVFALRQLYSDGFWLCLTIIVAVIASDTGAYFTGKKIGGAQMAPRISPKKTWAGFGGALFFAGLALMATPHIGLSLQPYLQIDIIIDDVIGLYPLLFILGMGIGVLGQGGDLLISFFKRRAGLKDAGDIIPGHGGILDRIDSVLLVSIISFALIWFWRL